MSDSSSADSGSALNGGSESAPRRFGHYLLQRELGRGAQGIVHLAEDTNLGRRVALKMLIGAQSQEVRDRFQREAKITSKLNHPGICGLYEVGEVEGVPYLAMQYVPGRTLADMLKEARNQQLDDRRAVQTITVTGRSSKGELQDVIRLIERVARALHVAHEAGLVHRDIKPHNVMVTPEGDPVLLDFGLARDLDTEGQTLTASGQVMGTPAYLAPEQIVADREHIDRRTDVYALGVTLFECVTLERPYDAPSWDQLYHKILEGNPPNPCKINPRIPKDLRTVIEVAMERDSRRRYATCLELAEDLQRVRSYEPITAKAANMLRRTGKWARRRPGRAAAAMVAIVFTGAGVGSLVYRAWHRHAMVTQYLGVATSCNLAGDYAGAREAVTQALTWDPDSARAVEMRGVVEASESKAQQALARETAFKGASAARADSEAHLAAYQTALGAIAEQRAELERRKIARASRAVPEAEAEGISSIEGQIEHLLGAAAGHLADAREALHRAARLEAPFGEASPQTESSFAEFYMQRYREAVQTGDTASVEVMRRRVREYDRDGVYTAELLARGTLTATVSAANAEVFLFRCEGYESVRSDNPVPRLVPVPTAGVGRVRPGPWTGGFHAGDPCLLITAVTDGSPAAAAGLQPGDLVVAIQGGPAAGVFVRAAAAALADQGVRPLQRIATLNGTPIECCFDWLTAPATAAQDAIALRGVDAAVTGDRKALTCCAATDLVHETAPAALALQCLHDGEPVTLQVPAGSVAGLRCEPTAYPLICAAQNRIGTGTAIEADSGSYLLLARAPGCEPQRFPVTVGWQIHAGAHIELLPAGGSPPGFVYVPAGPFRVGGDPGAFEAVAAGEIDLPAFWIARRELTNGEYYEFLNDPEVRARIAAANPPIYLPRDVDGKIMAKRVGDGPWAWAVYTATTAESPVLGLSWRDAADYVAWRNQRAEAAGEPWRYDLPSPEELEKAARGVDGRLFPWGNRFDATLTVCKFRKAAWLLDVAGGFEPRDESVYQVLDLAGSREEWTRTFLSKTDAAQFCHKLGGSWGGSAETAFHSASRGSAGIDRPGGTQGCRLVARRR